MDTHERRLLLENALVRGVLARVQLQSLTPQQAAEAELRARLEPQVSDALLVAIERAINDTLSRLSPAAMAQLFADSHDFEIKRLRDFFAPILSQLEASVGASAELAKLDVGHVRAWQWEREVLNHRRFVTSGKRDIDLYLQRPAFWRPDIDARPIWELEQLDPAYFELERAAPEIRAELEAVRSDQGWLPYRGMAENTLAQPADDETGAAWHAFFFYHPLKGRFDANHERCPVTSRVLEALPGLCRRELVLFSALAPGSVIPPHQGPFNGRLRVHLALTGSEGCFIRVGTQIRTWRDGKVLVFDDSFEHQVCHAGSELRGILMMNILQPGLDPRHSSVDLMSLTNPVHYVESDDDRRERAQMAQPWWPTR